MSDPKNAGDAVMGVIVPLGQGLGSDWLEKHAKRVAADPEYAAAWDRRDEQVRADEAQRRAGERALVSARRREQLAEAGVPEKDLDAVLGGQLADTQALKTAMDWLANGERILVLAGGKGVGKTTAAAWIACQVPGSRFLDGARLMRVDTYSDEVMNPLERAPLLVLDDLGAEYADAKGKLASLVDGLVNTRYANLRRTVVTTNLNGSAFKARYGERVADRIREVGRFVEIAGESLRGRRS